VDRQHWPSTYDRDLDVQRQRTPDPIEPIDRYRRLVANPLLAVSTGVLSLFILRASLRWENLAIFLGSVGLLIVSIFFTQFHCLDCGVTDWLMNGSRHACPRAVARWRAGRMDHWRLPALKTQLVLWLYFLASATALILIFFVLSR
jgi:hypothetical protein